MSLPLKISMFLSILLITTVLIKLKNNSDHVTRDGKFYLST